MKKEMLIMVMVCLAFSLSVPVRAHAGSASPALVSADWSVNAARNLAANPPSLNAVEDFTGRAVGESEENPPVDVCEFRFADLRNSGNLSLIVSVAPGSWGCTELYIFDKTPKGFEFYYRASARGHDLAHSVLDINRDGRSELVLWGGLAPFATGTAFGQLGCNAEWPLIFAWTGSTYSDVSDRNKDYYSGYLKSVNARLAAYSSVLAPAATQTANPAPEIGAAAGQAHGELSSDAGGEGPGLEGGPLRVAPAASPEGAATPAWAALYEAQRNSACTRIEAAKTEAFLGIASDSTMSAAVKDSESNDPNERIAAAVIFSFLGTQEAKQNLKTLSNDADPKVAAVAKTAASFGEDPPPYARTMSREDTYLKLTEPRQSKH